MSQEILESLANIANSWQPVALFWHVVGLAILVSVLAGPFLSRRRFASLLTLPLASVAVFAWAAMNPFNGVLFLVITVVLLLIGTRLVPGMPQKAHPANQVVGAILILFALVYPHFVDVNASWQYLLYAPVGLLPCPTLSLVVGASIMVRGFDSQAWSFTLAGFGLFYGLLGAFWLDVQLDWVLVAGSLFLLAMRGYQVADNTVAS